MGKGIHKDDAGIDGADALAQTSGVSVFEEKNHIINDYAKREQWMEAILAWFAKHLQCDSTWWDDLRY